jgi:hypothetical protein
MTKRILVAGAIAAHPLGGGGNTWAFLQWVLGFRRLGFDTYYIEHIEEQRCIDSERQPVAFAESANARYFAEVMQRFGLDGCAALIEIDGPGHVGLSRHELEELAGGTDLLVNISGRFHLSSISSQVRYRMYVDLDPGFVQIWQTQYSVDMNLPGHELYVTVGLNLGAPDCPMPTCERQWQPSLPPVVLDHWETALPSRPAYTTVADWRGYGPVEWNGVWYGQKAQEFVRIIDLPRRSGVQLELCLAIHPDEPQRQALIEHGWHLVSPRLHAATPDSYRDYIQASRGEVTAVKHGYAAGRTGWFSDRSACYLAAGRPVIMQDTGFGSHLPTGAGLLTFTDLDGAADALANVEANYHHHASAARQLARRHFDSDVVLTRLVDLAKL